MKIKDALKGTPLAEFFTIAQRLIYIGELPEGGENDKTFLVEINNLVHLMNKLSATRKEEIE